MESGGWRVMIRWRGGWMPNSDGRQPALGEWGSEWKAGRGTGSLPSFPFLPFQVR